MKMSLLGMILGSSFLYADTAAFDSAMKASINTTNVEKSYFVSQNAFELEDRAVMGFDYLYDNLNLSAINVEITPEGASKENKTLDHNKDALNVKSGMFSYGYRAVDWAYFFNLSAQFGDDLQYSAANAKIGSVSLTGKSPLKDLEMDCSRKNSYVAGFNLVRFLPQASVVVPYLGVGVNLSYNEFDIAFTQTAVTDEAAKIESTQTKKDFSIIPRAILGVQLQLVDSLLINLGGHISSSVLYNERMGSYDITAPNVPASTLASGLDAQKYTINPTADYNSYGFTIGAYFQL